MCTGNVFAKLPDASNSCFVIPYPPRTVVVPCPVGSHENPKRGWVGEHQSPAAYIDGTRLFAYRALRTKLSCRELNLALTETRTVSKSLAGEVPGASADQISRTRALNSQVEGELLRERGVRCKG